MSRFEEQDRLADKFLKKKGVVCIHKVARSGVTISLVKTSIETGKKVVIFEPVKRILRHIKSEIPRIADAKPKIACILPNVDLCPKLDTSLKLKFQFRENCGGCEYEGNPKSCMFQNLLLNDFDVYGLTYDKLMALLLSQSRDAEILLQKLWSCDVFILDEFTTAIIRDVPTLPVKETGENGHATRLSEKIEETKEHATRPHIPENESFVKEVFWSIVDRFLIQCENISKSGEYPNECLHGYTEEGILQTFGAGWRYISELTKIGIDTHVLQDVFLVALMSNRLSVICENGTTTVTPVLEDALRYLREFCEGIPPDKPVFLVDSYIPDLNFKAILGREVEHALWGRNGDPLCTAKEQLIVADTYHFGETDFRKGRLLRSRVQEFIENILQVFPPEKVLVVTTNMRVAAMISKWELPGEVRITWHRSDLMRGVPVENRRLAIFVGGPYLKKKAYTSSASSFRFNDFYTLYYALSENARKVRIAELLRISDTSSEFVNSIARIKDPKAEARSIVFTLGMRKSEAGTLLAQPSSPYVSQPKCIRPIRYGALNKDGPWIARLWFDRADVEIRDLPIVARIIRLVKEKKQVRASEILYRKTKSVLQIAEKYESTLREYGISPIWKRGGVAFSLLD